MDLYAIALKLTGQGLPETQAGLSAVEAAGTKAAAALSGAEASSARLSATLTAAQAAFARSQGGAQALAQSVRELDAAEKAWAATTGTVTGPGLGTFNQAIGQTERSALNSTRGLYMLDRGLGSLVGSALGASSGFERLGEGLLLFTVGGHEATLVLAVIAGAVIAAGAAWNVFTSADRAAQEQMDKAYASLQNLAGALGPLEQTLLGVAAATDKLAEAQGRLNLIEQIFGGTNIAVQTGGNPYLSLIAGLTAYLAKKYEQQKVDEAQQVLDKGSLASTNEIVKKRVEELQTLAERIKLGQLDAAGQQLLALRLQQVTELLGRDNLTMAQQNDLQKARQGITQAFADIQRKATEEEKKRTQAIKDQQEALIHQAELAERSLQVLGNTPSTVDKLRVATRALTDATSDDNIQRLIGLGLIDQAVQLLTAQKKAVEDLAKATSEAIPGRAGPSFGLGGVTTGAQGAPITFGQGISLAPAEQAALVPERALTAPFGQGLQAPLIPDNFFDQAIQALSQGWDRLNAVNKTKVRAVNASTVEGLKDLAPALNAAIHGIADALGSAIGGAIAGTTNFGKAMLAALGNAIATFGKAVIAEAILMKSALHFFATLGPVGALAAGIAMVALGSALGGAAQGAFAEGGVAGGTSASNTPVHVIVVGSATGVAAGIGQPAPFVYAPMNIGVTDPVGQAQISRMVQLAQRRNLPSGI